MKPMDDKGVDLLAQLQNAAEDVQHFANSLKYSTRIGVLAVEVAVLVSMLAEQDYIVLPTEAERTKIEAALRGEVEMP